MDTSKFKSVIVPREVYDEIRTLAHDGGRTISGQLRLIMDVYREKGRPQRRKTTAR